MLLLLAANAVVPDAPDSTPYAFPESAPWNVETYAITPTPDGTGSVVHPDVIDFKAHGLPSWRGWRFWMAVTPYYMANASKENPTILVSRDGFTWQTPTGAAPAYLLSSVNGGANSDTDLVYDPAADRLILTWREYKYSTPYDEWVFAAESTDGLTWSERTLIWHTDDPVDDRADNDVSQALVRVSSTDWRAFSRTQGAKLHMRTATDPLGTWSAPADCTLTGVITGNLWHQDVITHEGRLLAIFDYQWELRPGVSDDGGETWRVGAPFLTNRAGEWDDRTIYRSTFQPDGDWFRVWYATDSTTTSWRVAYTRVPAPLWDI